MENDVVIIEDFEEKVDVMRFYYRAIGDGKFLQALNEFRLGQGFGIGPVCCTFAMDYEPWEEGYFGDSGVNFSIHPPLVEIEENAIVDYETFYQYLKEASDNYLARNPHDKDKVKACLQEIKHKFDISQ
ncbi:hypothetical protein ADL26_14100 [Thermoactinomyces vulgaris]|jgi:hypothetical protein|nr:hypothetical protein ADL26_14100 [Thermoactinomyces vulgaris]